MSDTTLIDGKTHQRSDHWGPFIRIDAQRTCAGLGFNVIWPDGTFAIMVRLANYVLTIGVSDWRPLDGAA